MQSRYYNPEMGRFINADGIAAVTGDVLSTNLFAYCENNPVNAVDKDGKYLTLIGMELGAPFGPVGIIIGGAAFTLGGILGYCVGSAVNTYRKSHVTYSSKKVSSSTRGKKNKVRNDKSPHIFRKKAGYLEKDTPGNRKILEDVANNPGNYLGKDMFGNDWYAKIRNGGKQVWVESRDGGIFEGGVNNEPIPWDDNTGLCSPTKPK